MKRSLCALIMIAFLMGCDSDKNEYQNKRLAQSSFEFVRKDYIPFIHENGTNVVYHVNIVKDEYGNEYVIHMGGRTAFMTAIPK